MSDPAVEAAIRVRRGHPLCLSDHHADSCLTDAAREALKPIRELHKPHRDPPTGIPLCAHDHAFWPCETARLVYSSEELDRG